MSRRTRTFALIGLALATVSCNSKPTEIVGGTPDDMKEQLAKAKPVVLPPSISASQSLRCADNSLAFVDFYSDGMSARLTLDEKTGKSVFLKAPATGEPMVADGGYAISGGAKDKSVSITSPGHPKQSCHV